MRVFIADLGHNQLTISSDVYPLGVANLAAYVTANAQRKDAIDVSLFKEPQDLKAAIDREPPDVVGLSGYTWNFELSKTFARYAKARRPETLTLIGGPHYPLTEPEQVAFLQELPELDVAVRGPTYEGERAFLNIIDRFHEVGLSIEGLKEEPVAGNHWFDPKTSTFVNGGEVDRIRDLDEIPSPYLTGWMDPFFKTGYFPMMQIARGCPFGCTYCNSAVASNNKVFAHSIENVKADLDYIAQHVRPEASLCLADDNFGMFARDEEIAEYLGHLQDRYGWPKYIRTTTGKNQAERIIRVMRKTHNALPMTAAVQSLNPEVLKNIKRDNISLDAFAAIQKEVQALGMQSYGELILCLPGETKASFMEAVAKLLETGVQRVSAHQLMLLYGAPLSNPDSRERFQFATRFRVVARNLGDYTGEPVVEIEEMVVETPTFSFQDYLDTRVFHLLLTIYYYEGNFEEAFRFAEQQGVKPIDLIVRLQSMIDDAPIGVQKLIADFLRENQEELFPTREACLAWSREHFDGLADGTIGGNLLSKYSMLGRFFVAQDAMTLLQEGIAAALGESGSTSQDLPLSAVMEYLRCVMLHVPFAESLKACPVWSTSFDVEAWRDDGYTKGLEHYAYAESRTIETHVDPELKSLVESRIATFGEHATGLGKFTRTIFARDLRRKLVGSASATETAIGESA